MREKCHHASFKFRPQGALHTFAFSLGSLPWFENKPGLAWWRMRDHMVKSPAAPTEVILDQPIASQHSHMRELGQHVQRGQRNPKPTTDAGLSPAETRRPAQFTPRLMREEMVAVSSHYVWIVAFNPTIANWHTSLNAAFLSFITDLVFKCLWNIFTPNSLIQKEKQKESLSFVQ